MKRRILTLFITMVVVYGMLIMQPKMSHAATNVPELSSPGEVAMLEQPLEDIDQAIQEVIEEGMMPGATVLVARNGDVVKQNAFGYAARYVDDEFTDMDNPVEMQTDTIFDMASISKLFTAVAVMQLWDQGLI